MTKLDYLLKLRRTRSMDHLELVIDHMERKIPEEEIQAFQSAADHRRAELTCNRNFDKVPKEVWKLVK
ncbi:hypothetical protein QMI71_004574 [Salmonella enterica]|nr:hypothetical protein [Salmonella enterica]